MSKIILGPLISEIRGKTGSIVFSKNRSGNYIRRKTSPVQPNSTRQNDIRQRFSSYASYFKTALLPARRSAWSEWASNSPFSNTLGQKIYLSGINAFIRVNSLASLIGSPRFDDPPTEFGNASSFILDPTGFSISESTQKLTITDYSDITGADFSKPDDYAVINIGIPQNPGIKFFKGPYRFAAAIEGALIVPTFPYTLDVPFYCQKDQKVWISCTHFDPQGKISANANISTLVVA